MSRALVGRGSARPARYVVALGVAGFVAFAGCGGDSASRFPPTNFVAGSTGSDWFRIASAIAERANEALGGHPVTAVPGAGGISNPARVGQMPGDFGISFGPFLEAAYLGAPPYHRAYPNLRHVATLLHNKLQILVSETLGIESLQEIRDRRLRVRVGTGPPGSAEELLLRECLAFYGITYQDIRSWGGRIDLLGSGERADLFRDYHVDIISFHSVDPTPFVTELLLKRQAKLLAIPEDLRDALRDTWRVRAMRIEAATYANQDQAVETIGLDFGIFATSDVPEEMVYQVTRAVAEHRSYLESVHRGFRAWQPRDMLGAGHLPVHPGAGRYFREQGWLQP